jgi:hypothetical protein
MGFRNIQRSPGPNNGSGAALGNATPQAPGTPSAGVSSSAARDDHRHAPLVRKVIQFYVQNVPASATTQFNRAAGLTDFPFHVALRAGQVTGLSAYASGNPPAAATIRMTKATPPGASTQDTSLDLNITAGTTREFRVTGAGMSFAAGDDIRMVIITDAAWNVATVDFVVDVEITETA